MHHDEPPRFDDLPQLERILDRKRFAADLETALRQSGAPVEVRRAKVRRVYYRPDRSCRLLLDCRLVASGAAEVEQLYFGRIRRDDDLPEEAPGATLTRPAVGPAFVAVPALRLELRAYPNDPDLPGLAFLADATRVLSWLQRHPAACGLPSGAAVESLTLDLAKYVPGQRGGFRYALRWRNARGAEALHRAYAKAYPPRRGARVASTLRQIESTQACQSGALRLPHTHSYDTARGILWQEFVPGTKLSKDESAAGLLRHAAAAGSSLAAFHASHLRLRPGKNVATQIDELYKTQRALARTMPAWREACSRITEKLMTQVPDPGIVPTAPVHGSFKSSHMFEDDGRLVLIDFDGAGLGDPLYDVGRFVARVVAGGAHTQASQATIRATLERFRRSYAAGVPWGWPEERVRWSTCAHLIGSQVYKSVKRANAARVDATLRVATEWLPDAAARQDPA